VSKHVGRRQRWQQPSASEYIYNGAVVRPYRGGWYAWISYAEADPEVPPPALPEWIAKCERLGPFKRPRNAMMAAEEFLMLLQRRHGERVRLGTPEDRLGG
jgi:hypothetical protein